MRTPRSSFVPLLLLVAATCAAADELSPQDRELLEALLKGPLFDPPPAAERVLVKTQVRTAWAQAHEVEREAWLVPAEGQRPARVVFVDGRDAPAPTDAASLPRVDLARRVRERLRPRSEDEERDERFADMARAAGRAPQTDPDLALAAWLHRRGDDALAAALLARLRQEQQGRGQGSLADDLKADLAWAAFAGMVHAYMVREDAEALAHGEHLLATLPQEAREYAQAPQVVAELRRRAAKGTFGKAPPAGPPGGFAARPVEERVAWLVDALDEVDARQWGQPGGVDLASDWRVAALIELGEPAVPALIDALEQDERLTRSVHFWRDFARSRTVLAVREAALVAVMSILRVQAFEPASTGANFTAADPEKARDVARRLRDYWEQNKGLRIEQRMLKVLTSPDSSQEQLREAAQNLAELTGQRRIGTTVWATRTEPGQAGARNPALDLADPTAAEAILAAMDRDLAQGDPRWKGDAGMELYSRRKAETHYVECLIALGDARILPALQERAKAQEMRLRRQWALACHALGDPAPLAAFVAGFAAGSLPLPPIVDPGERGHLFEEPGAVELVQCVDTFLRLGTAEADQALRAAAAPGHPYREPLALLVSRAGRGFDGQSLLRHPFHLSLLAGELERTEPTGTTLRVEGGTLHRETRGGRSSGPFDPAAFGDAPLVERAVERRCDRAAERLASALLGLPRYHALMKDRDERLARLRADVPRLARSARLATQAELEALEADFDPFTPRFIPGFEPLDRIATREDFEAGRAVFHLGDASHGPATDVALPAAARLKLEGGREVPALVFQVEVLPTGPRRYGVLAADRVEAVGDDRLAGGLTGLPDPALQRAAARKLLERAVAGDADGVRALLAPRVVEELEPLGGVSGLMEQARNGLDQVGEAQLVEMLAPGFRLDADGVWRLQRLR